MKIKNTASNSGTSRLHDSEVMDDDYQVEFTEQGGTVATVRQEVGEALAEKYPGIEVVDDGTEDEDDSESDTPDQIKDAGVTRGTANESDNE